MKYSPSGKVLLLAATGWEASPLARSLGLRPTRPGQYEGRVRSRNVLLLQTGIGPEAAARALGQVSASRAPTGFSMAVSTGFAGALQPELRPGDLIADLPDPDCAAYPALAPAAAQAGLRLRLGRIAHSDTVLDRPEQKRALGAASQALAVDMETAALRSWAQAYGLPALGLRLILDRLEDGLPGAVPEDAKLFALLGYLSAHLLQFPLLARLGLRTRRLMPRYGLFLSDFLSSLNVSDAITSEAH
ncbi:MAG: hypothetical protein WC881_10510 [Elusimicrobiota bacterium]|jgi:nucleoside phosphorylase